MQLQSHCLVESLRWVGARLKCPFHFSSFESCHVPWKHRPDLVVLGTSVCSVPHKKLVSLVGPCWSLGHLVSYVSVVR